MASATPRAADSHLAPAPPDEPVTERRGLRSLVHFGRDIGRFVRLAERQGTRLVDVFDRYVRAIEAGNVQATRLADAAERMVQHADGYLGEPAGDGDDPWCSHCDTGDHTLDDCPLWYPEHEVTDG